MIRVEFQCEDFSDFVRQARKYLEDCGALESPPVSEEKPAPKKKRGRPKKKAEETVDAQTESDKPAEDRPAEPDEVIKLDDLIKIVTQYATDAAIAEGSPDDLEVRKRCYRELMKEFGVEKMGELPADRYPEMASRVRELSAEFGA